MSTTWILLLLTLCVVTLSAKSDTFKEVEQRWRSLGLPLLASSIEEQLIAPDGTRLHYTIFFPNELGTPIVISPGLGETGIFYTEAAWILRQSGFAPIYVLDHRGNGRSSRILADPSVAHMDNFRNHLEDFSLSLSKVVAPHRRGSPNHETKPLLIGHSMGAAIAIGTLADQPERQKDFRGMVIFSPMLQINLRYKLQLPWVDRWFEWVSLDLNFGDQVPAESLLSMFRYWRPQQRVIGQGPVSEEYSSDNNVTHSEGHWRLLQLVEQQVGTPLLIKTVTNSWVFEGMKLARYARENINELKLPLLATEAEEDSLVRGEPIRELAKPRHAMAQYRLIKGSRHASHLENQPIRQQLWREIVDFGCNPNK